MCLNSAISACGVGGRWSAALELLASWLQVEGLGFRASQLQKGFREPLSRERERERERETAITMSAVVVFGTFLVSSISPPGFLELLQMLCRDFGEISSGIRSSHGKRDPRGRSWRMV